MIVITGGAGRLGAALRQQFAEAAYPTRQELDILNLTQVRDYLGNRRPKVLIHAAAMTDVRAAQTQRDQCWQTNVGGTENIVAALRTCAPECLLVYVSTACVFQGDRGNYSEDDHPYPKNFYGLSKLVAEYVARNVEQHLIIRTNFVAQEPWPFPRAFTDRFGTYLYANDVAAGIRQFLQQGLRGLVHLAGSQRMSMHELAALSSPEVGPMTLDDVTLPLTVDMTLRSQRVPAMMIGTAQFVKAECLPKWDLSHSERKSDE